MRLLMFLSPNEKVVPFNYQNLLVGTLHKWLGKKNALHDDLSLYSFSWLNAAVPLKDKSGLNYPYGTTWFISFWDEKYIDKIQDGILKDNSVICGMSVTESHTYPNPDFIYDRYLFEVWSPVFIRSYENNPNGDHLLYDNPMANELLTQTMKRKMKKAGVKGEVDIQFDPKVMKPTTKMVTIKGIKNKASFCSVAISGEPHVLQFAWNVGVGHCTGMGFGALNIY